MMSSLRSSPAPQPHRIMTSPERARTEPASRGFMRSVMWHHDIDEVDDERVTRPGLPILLEKKITQQEQDAIDEQARKRAMRNLVNSWQERLQLISVITTFFASTEAAMLVNTKPGINEWGNGALKAANASLLGALIVHVYAAVLSFLGAFLLIRYKLKEATQEEMLAEGMVNSPLSGTDVFRDVEGNPANLGLQQMMTNNYADPASHNALPPEQNKKGSYPVEPPILARNPHLEQVGPFRLNVSSHLLSRTHALCVLLAAAGFILAIVGILCYAWASQPTEVSIFASICLGGAVLAMTALFI